MWVKCALVSTVWCALVSTVCGWGVLKSALCVGEVCFSQHCVWVRCALVSTVWGVCGGGVL